MVGPFRGGRSGAVVGDVKQKNVFYMGATGGGVWKTMDAGSNWKNITDKYFGGSIGCVAIAPSDPTILYVGEGENTLRGNVCEGFGIWRTDDGGRSWKNIGLKDSRHITRIIIHPKNPDIVWVAVLGHLFGSNTERGIYKTIDGGKNWKRILFSDAYSGAVDLVMEPGNPQTLYASTWTVIRTPYSMESGGKGSALWKSVDGGETWTKLNDKKGFPNKGVIGIIGVAIAPSNPELIYAIVENEKGGLYVSENAGETWTLQNSTNDIRQRAWYYSKVFVDPKNQDLVYILNVNFLKSSDGGKTFKIIDTPHGDHHDLWLDAEDGKRMIIADDGGAQISFNGGEQWSSYHNQPTAQFYRVSTDNHYPYRILSAQQDNSTVRILSQSEQNSITQNEWSSTAGFESGYVVADPANPEVVYGGNYGGYLSRLDHTTGENRAISVWPITPIGQGADEQKYRFQWNFPIFFSPHNRKKLYAGGNVLFATENEGASWSALGGDLTTNDKNRQRASGGPITKDNTGVETYCTIFTATESSLEKDLLWVGSDDGLIHMSKDAGKNWENVTPPAAGKWMMWNCVETDPFKKGKAYFVGTKYKSDDYKPYIFKTEDYGKTWKQITNGIPAMHFTRCLRADQNRSGLLYCGTEYGMYISYDDGANWKPFQLNLPKVSITDLTIKENDLVVATQGRALWVLDDLGPVQQLNSSLTQKNLFAFDISPAFRYNGNQNLKAVNAGINPVNGVVVNYFVKDFKDSSKVIIIIKDENKKIIKSFSTNAEKEPAFGKPVKIEVDKGMNQFVWDMYYPDPVKVEGMIFWGDISRGPKAGPGRYFLTIKMNTDSLEKELIIKANPVYKCSDADYKLKTAFLVKVIDKFNEVQKNILKIRDYRNQINGFTATLGKDCPKEIKTASDSINKQITRVEEALYQTKLKSGQDILNFPMQLNNKISSLYNYIDDSETAPNKQALDAYDELEKLANLQLTKFKNIVDTDISKLNQLITAKALPLIILKKEEN
ncbi:MAG: glycosyl hydrolase [Bacteroidota bacterium]